ncbi:MAG: lactate racemase domain-containing protein [Candidatus Sumerlaeota bacterium]|nr:lactate racemase domain-containing protein [Candidatus Sumerlaeota bacterium]
MPSPAALHEPQTHSVLNDAQIRQAIHEKVDGRPFAGKRTLVIVPDTTRSGPLKAVFAALHEVLAPHAKALDAMIALGTHPPMSDSAIREHLGIAHDPAARFRSMKLLNHEWDNPAALETIGWLSEEETERLSGGRMRERVPVRLNRRALEYDCLLVAGPVFPHEVVGFSGGNKYFFPGIAGPDILDFFHWLGALITNMGTIGVKRTPMRAAVDRAASLIPRERLCLAYVVAHGGGAHGVFYGTPEEAWSRAADVSAATHIRYVERPFQSVLSCAPKMYDELWVGGKCMYKLEPVVADGGELIIYAPHIARVSITHGKLIGELGYHVADYFLKQWDKFSKYPRTALAHSTHVRGVGTFENGVEKPRIQVALATAIPPEECKSLNLGWRDWRSIDPEQWRRREAEGLLLVENAGEVLYRLK